VNELKWFLTASNYSQVCLGEQKKRNRQFYIAEMLYFTFWFVRQVNELHLL